MFGASFLYFEGKGGPKHKEFTGSGVAGGGGGYQAVLRGVPFTGVQVLR